MNSAFLFSNESIVFTTREYALEYNLTLSAASHRLKTLKRAGSIIALTRGIWACPNHPFFSPLCCVAKLLGSEQGYVSFLTALHLHGLLSQIPTTVQIATTGRSRKLITPVGTFEFFQLKSALMREGVDWSDSKIPYRIASAEKSLFDTLYISTRKGNRFAKLPELDLQSGTFKPQKFARTTSRASIPASLKTAILNRIKI